MENAGFLQYIEKRVYCVCFFWLGLVWDEQGRDLDGIGTDMETDRYYVYGMIIGLVSIASVRGSLFGKLFLSLSSPTSSHSSYYRSDAPGN